MKRMNSSMIYRFKKLACLLLTLIMAASLVVAVACSITMGLLRSESFVHSRFEKYNSQLLEEVNTAVSGAAESTGLPVEAYTSSIGSDNIQSVLNQVSTNIVNGYKTDFSDSKYLYGYYHTGLMNYCTENGISLTEDELNKDACLAVDVFNNAVGDESTSSIIFFALTYSKNPLYAIIIAVIAFIAGIFIIDFISFGRHKKLDYTGISLITGGGILTSFSIFAVVMKYSSLLRFTDVDVYNRALADVFNDLLMIIAIIGAAAIVIGIVIVCMNYSYYKNKSAKIKKERDFNVKLKNEFIREYNDKHSQEAVSAGEFKIQLNEKEKEE